MWKEPSGPSARREASRRGQAQCSCSKWRRSGSLLHSWACSTISNHWQGILTMGISWHRFMTNMQFTKIFQYCLRMCSGAKLSLQKTMRPTGSQDVERLLARWSQVQNASLCMMRVLGSMWKYNWVLEIGACWGLILVFILQCFFVCGKKCCVLLQIF